MSAGMALRASQRKRTPKVFPNHDCSTKKKRRPAKKKKETVATVQAANISTEEITPAVVPQPVVVAETPPAEIVHASAPATTASAVAAPVADAVNPVNSENDIKKIPQCPFDSWKKCSAFKSVKAFRKSAILVAAAKEVLQEENVQRITITKFVSLNLSLHFPVSLLMHV